MHKDPRSTQPIPNYFQGEDSHDPFREAMDATPVPCESDVCNWPIVAPLIARELRTLSKGQTDSAKKLQDLTDEIRKGFSEIKEWRAPMNVKMTIAQWLAVVFLTLLMVPVIVNTYSRILAMR